MRKMILLGTGFLVLAAAVALAFAFSPADQSKATFIGSSACGKCHEENHALWSQSLHSRMIQPAGERSILGNFNDQMLRHQGWSFKMTREDGRAVILETDANGKKTRYQIDFTLGSKRIQHYLSKRSDGRIRVTFPTWDVQKQAWFHSSEIIPTGHHAEVSIQVWNQHCYNCHVGQESQGFDIETNTYDTRFTETGINCEMCHGPGSVHAEVMKADPQRLDRGIIHPGKLEPEKQVIVCVQCHTPRVIVQHGFNPAKNYYDYYMPTLMHFYIERWYDPPMWADGRMRRFATEGAALWQSQCFLQGDATCISCHNPHLNNVKRDERFRDTDILCTQCHENFNDDEKVMAHTQHPLHSKGSQCIDCHMPATTTMMKDFERDHTISIPVPETTKLYDIPNACNNCHTDQSPAWAMDWMDRWYPGRPTPNLRRANAFIPAGSRDPKAIGPLIDLLRDRHENRVIRGSAAGFLGEFEGESVGDALIAALEDPDPMVRGEAARSLSEVRSPKAVDPLLNVLNDENRIVRLNAFFALIKMGILKHEGPARDTFERVRTEFEQFLTDFPDVYDIRVSLGTYHAVQGNYLLALQEYKNAVKVQPQTPLAHYYIGITYAQLGLLDSALQSFKSTLILDPDFRNTKELLKQVEEAREQGTREQR